MSVARRVATWVDEREVHVTMQLIDLTLVLCALAIQTCVVRCDGASPVWGVWVPWVSSALLGNLADDIATSLMGWRGGIIILIHT